MSTDLAPTVPSSRRLAGSSKPRRRRNVLAHDEPPDVSAGLAGVYIRVSTTREEMISPCDRG